MTHFNKRHYEAIAKVMQETHPGAGLSADNRAVMQWEDTVRQLSRMFINDNPLFITDRFCHACKPGSNVKARTAHLKVA